MALKIEPLKLDLAVLALPATKPQEQDIPQKKEGLKEVIDLLREGSEEPALTLFSKLSMEHQNAIYGQIWRIMGGPQIEKYGEKAFLNQSGLSAELRPSLAQKAQAIDAYLALQAHREHGKHLHSLKDKYNIQAKKHAELIRPIWGNPYDATLVPLKGGFINANLVLGGKYIQTQAPLKRTVDHFWRMIQEQGVKTIVMLPELHEDQIFYYFPQEIGQSSKIDGMKITLMDEEVTAYSAGKHKPTLATRKILLEVEGQPPREVTHFHYVNWVDNTFPNRKCLLKLIDKVSEAQAESLSPIVVHCRFGKGRTMTFTTTHHLVTERRAGRNPDLMDLVKNQSHPETGRSSMMLTEHQFLGCHDIYSLTIPAALTSKSVVALPGTITLRKEPMTVEGNLAKVAKLFAENQEQQALKLAAGIPQSLLNQIYGKLWKVMGSPRQDDFGRNAFHNHHGLSAPALKKAEAICQHLGLQLKDLHEAGRDREHVVFTHQLTVEDLPLTLEKGDFEGLKGNFISKDILAALKKDPILKRLLEDDTGVDGPLEGHCQRVIANFERFFASSFEFPKPMTSQLFRLFLALHDLAKPGMQGLAKNEERITAEHEITSKMMEKVLSLLGFSGEQVQWCQFLVKRDPIGDYLKASGEEVSLREAELLKHVKEASHALSVSPREYFDVHFCYYMCDAGSYTKVAGSQGLDAHFLFDLEHSKMQLASHNQSKIEKLLEKI